MVLPGYKVLNSASHRMRTKIWCASHRVSILSFMPYPYFSRFTNLKFISTHGNWILSICKGLCSVFEIRRTLNKTSSLPLQNTGPSPEKWQGIMIYNNASSLCQAFHTQYFKESQKTNKQTKPLGGQHCSPSSS